MAEGIDQASDAFSREIAPASHPRDQAGRFVPTAGKPESMFSPRPIEGDPLTGDTSDAGENPRFREHERNLADGWSQEGDEGSAPRSRKGPAKTEGESRQRLPDGERARARHGPADQGHDDLPPERFQLGSDESDEHDQDAQGEDSGPDAEVKRDAEGTSGEDAETPFEITLNGKPVEKFEIEVDGQPVEVSLNEALKGYTNEASYQKKMGQFGEAVRGLQTEAQRLAQARDQLLQERAAYEEDVRAILPQEPDWDALFKADPAGAHELQKKYQEVHARLNASRMARQKAIQEQQQAQAQWADKKVVDEFAAFVQMAGIENQGELNRELESMRRTAFNEGFTEEEVGRIYDKRMFRVLQKASKYDRMMANRPKAVMPGKGRALTPGTAKPLASNAPRRSLDEALSRQAKSGRLEDKADVFARMLR